MHTVACFTALSDAHYYLGNLDSAEHYAIHGLRLNRKYETGFLEKEYTHLARAAVAAERGQYQLAQAHTDSAHVLAEDLNDRYAHVLVYISEARIAAAQGAKDEFTERIDAAISMAEKHSIISSKRLAIEDRVELLSRLGSFEEAIN